MKKTPKILIVDDEERNLRLLEAMLSDQNYSFLMAQSGEEALQIAENTIPDLVLLDIMMPGVNGFDVCSKLKKDEKTKMVPIVMVTASNEKEHRIEAIKCGADDFLNKPVDRHELCARVSSLLRIKSYHDDLANSLIEISQKNEKLKELEKTKEQLIHMIIHDLNGPLHAITLGLEVFTLRSSNFSDDETETLKKCSDSCSDIKHLIQSMLDIHKMEEGKLEPRKNDTDAAGLIREVLAQFTFKANSKQIQLSFDTQDDLPPVSIDKNLIKRVVMNLLENALRHSRNGDSIRLFTQFDNEKKVFRFTIKDNGMGVPPQYHRKIFDKFEQVKLSKEGFKLGKSGLGLAFSKMAIEAHGGKIWVESEGLNQGSTFIFEIPVG